MALFAGGQIDAQTTKTIGQKVVASGGSKTAPVAIRAVVEVNWEKPVSRAAPYLFGTNDNVIADPKEAADESLEVSLRSMSIPILRLANRDLIKSWTDEKSKGWNSAKIQAAYNAPYLRHCLLLQNIPGWPSWMKQEQGRLDPAEYDRYAAFCADLVHIINIEQGRRVIFWEPLGEIDNSYFTENHSGELWEIYNKSAAAMKQADPTVKVGGGLFSTGDPTRIEAFLNACGSNVDFITWRFFPSEEMPVSTERIMQETPQAKAQAETLRASIRKALPGRTVPLVLDTFGMSRSGGAEDARMGTIIGAVWSASVLKHLADAGVDMATFGRLKESAAGLVDLQNRAHPAATIYAWGNQYLVGDVMETSSDEPTIEAMAVRRANKSRQLLLINKSEKTAQVALKMKGKDLFGQTGIRAERLDANGYSGERMTEQEMKKSLFTLPPYSLLLMHFPR